MTHIEIEKQKRKKKKKTISGRSKERQIEEKKGKIETK